jgi:hypothetical protein
MGRDGVFSGKVESRSHVEANGTVRRRKFYIRGYRIYLDGKRF